MSTRQDLLQSRTEGFEHDALDRLTRAILNGSETLAVSYLPSGNIVAKSDVGSYSYADPAHPHAVTSAGPSSFAYDANGNQTSRNGNAQTYASFNLPTQLASSGTQSALRYGPEHQRWRQIASYANGTETTHYVGEGLLEKVHATSTGHTYYRHYVETPGGQRIVVSRNSNNTGSRVYQLTDHLGSTDAVLDAAGSVYTRQSFAAFGGRRGSDWSASTLPDLAGIANSSRHGFTGHEHLDNLALIHMNGRVYDPQIGRFLSVDPLIGDLADSQSVNPYAYVGNRPLSYTDPTGLSAADGSGGSNQGGGFGGYQKNDGSPGSWKWWEQQFSSIGDFFDFGSDPPPRPASALPGISGQNGVAMCGAGTFSPVCGGTMLYAGAPAGGADGVPTSSWVNQSPVPATSLIHYAGEFLIGAPDSLLQGYYELQPLNPSAGIDQSAADLLGPYQSPFSPAVTSGDRRARNLGATGTVLASVLTGRPVGSARAITKAAQAKGDDFFRGFARRNPSKQITRSVGNYTEFSVDVPGSNGQSFTRWVKVVGEDGRTIRLYHDTFDNTGKFLGRGVKVPGPERHVP